LITEKTLESATRKRIYQFILKYPGLHKRELSRRLNIPKTTLNHHLDYLEKRGFIVVKPEGKYTRFYVANNVGNLEKKLIHILRQDTPCNIILYIATMACASQVELSKELELTSKTIGKHLKMLVDVGIIEPAIVDNGVVYTALEAENVIERTPIGKEVIYILAKKPNSDVNIGTLVGDLFILYEDGFVNDEIIKEIIEIFHIIFPDRKNYIKRIKTYDVTLKLVEKIMWDIFPLSFRA